MTAEAIIAQDETALLIQTCQSTQRLEETLLVLKKDPLDVQLSAITDQLIQSDYLEASVDSIQYDSLQGRQKAYIHIGPQYNFESISLDSLSQSLLKQLGIKPPTDGQTFILARQRLAEYYANSGYPFAKVRLKDMTLDSGQLQGALSVDQGKRIILDSIIVHGDLKLRSAYLRNYLEIFAGENYNHQKVKEARRKLDKLKFVTVEKEPELSFINSYASLNLYLKAKNTSRLDLIFGVIPTNNVQGKQLFLSMDFTTELLNKFGYGEYIYVDFERLRPEQQRFNVKFTYPYLLDTPFAISASFDIFRNALDYQNTEGNLGLQYALNSTDYVKAEYNSLASKIIAVDSLAVLSSGASGALPDRLSVTQVGMALEFGMNRLDNANNPRSGFGLKTRAILGQRKILVDPGIVNLSTSEIDFQKLYDQLDLVSAKYQLQIDGSIYKPIANRGAIGGQLHAAYMDSPALLENEKFQIGGNKLLRGFDEASLFTAYYAVTTLEYRLLLAQNSYFTLPFLDIGLVESTTGHQWLFGLGGGLTMETKAGMFNFAVAVGRAGDQGFDFARPKAHFGFISLF